MAFISIEKIQIGMILNDEVCDRMGRVLLKSGCALQQWHIDKLTSSGVEEVDITGVEFTAEQNDESITDEMVQQSVEALNPAFLLVDKEWDVMKELHRLAVLSDVRKRMEGEQL
jgi:hypothetical protein